MVSSGARIANERQTGWTRQLRITPLSTRAYFRAKVITAYAMAATTIVLLYAAGFVIGVRMPAGRWLEMTGLLLVGLMPFAALGVLLGHVLNVDSIGAATGVVVSLLALFSGTWFPVADHGFLHDIAQALPSYWLTQASHVSLGGDGWGDDRLARRRRVDGRARQALPLRLPARHEPRLTARAGDYARSRCAACPSRR